MHKCFITPVHTSEPQQLHSTHQAKVDNDVRTHRTPDLFIEKGICFICKNFQSYTAIVSWKYYKPYITKMCSMNCITFEMCSIIINKGFVFLAKDDIDLAIQICLKSNG